MKDYILPSFPEISELSKEDLQHSFWGTEDFALVNEALIRAVLQYKELNQKIAEYERKKIKADLEYKHKYRLSYLSKSEGPGTESWKKSFAEMECEKEEIKLQYFEEICRELVRKSNEIKLEIDVLKTISFNIRQELSI